MTQQLSLDQDIKLVVLDVDNTLLNSKSELSDRNAAAIAAVQEKGVKVMLATGKNYGSCKHIISRLKLTVPSIFTQGLAIHDPNGTLRHEKTLDSNVARRIITFAEDRGFAVVAYAQGRIISRTQNQYVEELHTRWKEVKPEYIGPLQNHLHNMQFNKLVLVSAGDEKKIKGLRWQLSTQLNGTARLISGGVPNMLEVLPPGGSKGNALRALLKELNIDAKNVLAIGDAENDIEMVELAGLGLAVGNAEDALKSVADETIATNDEDAVAQALEKYVLKTEPEAETTGEGAEDTPEPTDEKSEE